MGNSWQASVVLIVSSDLTIKNFGTGFVIHNDTHATYLLTCTHVVREIGGFERIQINDTQARVYVSSPEDGADLTVLRIENPLDMLSLSLCVASETGKPFSTAGFQFEDRRFVIRELHGTLGKQVGIQMKGQKDRINAWDLEITDKYPLQPGYSGSPVVDEHNYVIGVVNTRRGEGKTGAAIFIETLEKIWPTMPPSLFVQSTVVTDFKEAPEISHAANVLPTQFPVFSSINPAKGISVPPTPTGRSERQENPKDRILYMHLEPEEYGKSAARGIYDLVQTWPEGYDLALARKEGRIDSGASFLAIWDEKQAIVFDKRFQQLRQDLWRGEQNEQIENEVLQQMEDAKKAIQPLLEKKGNSVVFAPHNANPQTCDIYIQAGIVQIKYKDNMNLGITTNSVIAEIAASSNMFARMFYSPKAQETYILSLLEIHSVQSHEQLAERFAIARAIIGMGSVYLASYAMDSSVNPSEHHMARIQLTNLPNYLRVVNSHYQRLSANLISGKASDGFK